MPMLCADKSFLSPLKFSSTPYPPPRKGNVTRQFRPTLAKKASTSENPGTKGPVFQLRVSRPLLARAAVAVLGLGFLDAGRHLPFPGSSNQTAGASGYSGDWSRIGVISKEIEGFLQAAAYVITPLCLFLIYLISGEEGGVKRK